MGGGVFISLSVGVGVGVGVRVGGKVDVGGGWRRDGVHRGGCMCLAGTVAIAEVMLLRGCFECARDIVTIMQVDVARVGSIDIAQTITGPICARWLKGNGQSVDWVGRVTRKVR